VTKNAARAGSEEAALKTTPSNADAEMDDEAPPPPPRPPPAEAAAAGERARFDDEVLDNDDDENVDLNMFFVFVFADRKGREETDEKDVDATTAPPQTKPPLFKGRGRAGRMFLRALRELFSLSLSLFFVFTFFCKASIKP